MKVVRLSASGTGRLYHQKIFLILIFTRGWVDPRTMAKEIWTWKRGVWGKLHHMELHYLFAFSLHSDNVNKYCKGENRQYAWWNKNWCIIGSEKTFILFSYRTQYHRCCWIVKQNHISNQNKNKKIILKWMLLFETNAIKKPSARTAGVPF